MVFLNSFPALPRLVPGEYPLLSETIGSMTSNGLVQMGRTQGYAFHLLGEGFIIMGMWGALYNFLALLFSFSFYKFLTNSLDPKGKENLCGTNSNYYFSSNQKPILIFFRISIYVFDAHNIFTSFILL